MRRITKKNTAKVTPTRTLITGLQTLSSVSVVENFKNINTERISRESLGNEKSKNINRKRELIENVYSKLFKLHPNLCLVVPACPSNNYSQLFIPII